MLDIVEELLPFGSEQWQNAVSRFNTNISAGCTDRDGESLKRKFQKLVRVPKPMGDGVCPEEAQRAKRLQYAIKAGIAVVNLHEDESDIDEGTPEDPSETPGQEAPPTDENDTNSLETASPASVTTVNASSTTSSPPEPTSNSSPHGSTATTSARSIPLQATARACMEPSELAELSKALGKRPSSSTSSASLSQTARRRISLDRMVDNVNSDLLTDRSSAEQSNSMVAILLAMEERHEVREAQYRREHEIY